MTRVIVLGGGVIGLASAWELARRGCAVEVWDPSPGQGASYAAGGMLAPVSEATYDELELQRLLLESHRMWPGLAARLREASGVDPDLHETGSFHIGLSMDDARQVWRTADLLASYDLPHERLSSRELRRALPALVPGVRTGLRVDSDLWVDNRLVVGGLLAACTRVGVELVRRAGVPVVEDGAVVGARAVDGSGPVSRADRVVLSAGHASAEVLRLAGLAPLPVRPVKGQIIRMSGAQGLLEHTIRGIVHGDHVYLVPRGGGELAIGATSEELADTDVTGRGLLELLRAATTLLPEVGELVLVDAIARLRPGTPDNGPLMGLGELPGLVVSTGHHRHGILLAPVSAQVTAELVLDGATTVETARPFVPERFARAAADGTHDSAAATVPAAPPAPPSPAQEVHP